jgi:hypothetical protein
MSLKDLFTVKNVLPPISNEQIAEDVESVELLNSHTINKNRIEFAVDYSTASNFAVYGSAEKYYSDSFTRIYEQYPYDGSRKEKIDWENSSSPLDVWMFENVYPKTTGYATFSPSGWSALVGSQVNGYGEPTTKEYISIKGGPNTNSSTSLVDKFKSSNNQNQKANVYNVADNRNTNLNLNLSGGVSLEFWLKKSSFINSSTTKEVIFDLWNNTVSSSNSYGRLTLELSGTSTGSPFYLTIMSGTTGFSSYNIGNNLTTASVTNGWNHYAVVAQNFGSNINVKLYVNGELNFNSINGTNINPVTGAFLANIGALKTAVSGSPTTAVGWGKLSGSLDEFRFWKAARTSKDIGRYWWTNVYGGTNSDDANTDLGVYYKFNEGITTTSSVDSVVLDYSGRISNGTWIGYSASSRNIGSAINEFTVELSPEIADPIIYVTHPDVVEQLAIYTTIGSDYDRTNSNSIYYSFPNWIIDEDNGNLLNLTQIMGYYLDNLYQQVKNFTNIKEHYSNIQIDEKPFPFAKNLLDSLGLITPNIFIDAKLFEEVLSRDEDRNYEDKLNEIKNIIYENIYSNLQSIYKTKGTEKSVRNLLRCFGIDEKLVKLNIYSNNDTKIVSDDLTNITVKKRSINFNDTDRFVSTIYQFSTSSYADSNSYISGSSAYDYTPFTFEVDTVFPKKLKQNQNEFFPTFFLKSSIFGAHTAKAISTDLGWETNDYFNFQIYAQRPELESEHATFYLSSSNSAIPTLSSSLFLNVYNNEKWNFAVRFKPTALDNSDLVSGTLSNNYTIEFYGVSTVGDSVIREFNTSAIIPYADGINLTRANKRFYLGAERANFTGSLIKQSDIKILDFKIWSSYLDNQEIKAHARDTDNYGVKNAVKSAYLTETGINSQWIPKIETLILHWDFNQITGSDGGSGVLNASDGKFIVNDLTSGSLSYNRYNAQFNTLKKYDYIGRGDFFLQNDTTIIDTQYLFTSRINEFENIQNSNLINILTQDEQNQSRLRETRPVNYFFSFEKSMYGTISEEMLKMFSTIIDFNNLVGDPVNKYRKDYKSLNYLRRLFFQNVQNEPNLDKYLDFYKWIDSALGKLLLQLVPSSADTSSGLLNVIENHALERNKHQYKFPTMEFKEPVLEVGADSINKHLYNWKYGHRPLNNSEDENCLYWNAKAERDVAPLSSSISGTNYTRNQILSTTLQVLNRSFTTPYRYKVEPSVEIKGGTNLHKNANVGFFKAALEPHGPMDTDAVINVPANILFIGIENTSSVLKDCTDVYNPNTKVKYHFTTVQGRDYLSSSLSYGEVLKSDIAIPANFISGTVESGYNADVASNFMKGVIITNLHNDTYGHTKEVPMQGPFTNQWVGGLQSRHVPLNQGVDDYTTRPEAWKLLLGTGSFTSSVYQTALAFVGADYPYPEGNPGEPSYPVTIHKRATYYRDFIAKTPYNVKNIQSTTSSLNLGNYDRKYQYLHTFGKTTNNKLLIDATSSLTQTELFGILRTDIVDGRVNFTLPTQIRSQTIIGNRFSAPGDYRTNSRGYLNVYAEELSPYNALPFRNRTIIGDSRRVNETLTNDSVLYTPEIVSGSNKTLNALIAIPSAFGGYQSGSTTIASLHKISRNGGWEIEYSGNSTIIKQQLDNGFYSYAIPKTDSQYAWIATSLSSSDKTLPEYQGYLPETIASGSTSYEPSLTTVTQSVVGAISLGGTSTYGYEKGLEFIPVDFVGLNTIILDNVTSNTPTLLGTFEEVNYKGGLVTFDANYSYPRVLNGILLNRNGPYGYPTFKQVRTKNKLVNKLDKTNTVSMLLPDNNVTKGIVQNIQEPAVYYNYPLEIVVQNNLTGEKYTIITSYDNIKQSYENPTFKNVLFTTSNQTVVYDNLIAFLSDNPNYSLISISYNKQIYPKKQFATLDTYKKRDVYNFELWRDSRIDRNSISHTDSVNDLIIPTQSVWPLDGRIDANVTYLSNSSGGEGILQNSYSSIHNGITSSITASALYSFKHMLPSGQSWSSPSVSTLVDPTTTILTIENGLFDGTALWQAGEIAGKNPYYDSYNDWYQDIKSKNKNYQILPEYVISDSDSKVAAAINSTYTNPTLNVINITGSSLQNNSTTFKLVYRESDALDNIEKFSKDSDSTTIKTNITLTCDALVKLNPQPSFYPVNRTVDLANYFVQGIAPNLTAWTSSAASSNFYSPFNSSLRNILVPTFAPGLMYNTIKSGIAVDFPILTSSLLITSSYLNTTAKNAGAIDYKINNPNFDQRLPFETLYEPEVYLTNTDLIDLNPHPSATINVTSSWNGTLSNLYKHAMHNFLSEVVDFYLPEGKLTSIISKPETEFKKVSPNKEYRALVKIYKSKPTSSTAANRRSSLSRITNDATENYPRPQFSNSETENITMYNRASAFGPPINGGNTNDDTIGVAGVDSSTGYYSPFTPPYYDGESWVLLTYKPTGSVSYVPTLNDIISNITASYLRYEFNSGTLATSSVPLGNGFLNSNSMQASASLNLFNVIQLDQTNLNNISNNATVVAGSKVWAIQTKFETPILNFADSANTDTVVSGNQINPTIGMWHQYGRMPSNNEGIYLQITDVPRSYIKYGGESDERITVPTGRNPSLTGSLADVVGFSKDAIKLGQIASEKVIEEAVIAIPYVSKNNERQYFEFGSLAKQYVEFMKSEQSEITSFAKEAEVPDTVKNQVKLMDKYILPPQLDFMKNNLIDPIAMYIFEFSYTLTQQDLIDVWQGLMPSVSITFAEQSQQITHELPTDVFSSELLGKTALSDNLQWFVFKAKKKAKNNYNNKLLQSVKATSAFNKTKAIQSLGKAKFSTFSNTDELEYSYNWPYDFFSLVETAKIEAKVDFLSYNNVETSIDNSIKIEVPPVKSSTISTDTANKLGNSYSTLENATKSLTNVKVKKTASTAKIEISEPTITNDSVLSNQFTKKFP